jgi:hypothetical protein
MKTAIWRILSLLLWLSFGVMITIGLLMGYELIPRSSGSPGLETLGWTYRNWGDSHAFLINVFFTLATLNLLMVWTWLIRCAAKGDFLRLIAGLLIGAVIIAILLALTPSYCSGRRWHFIDTSPAPFEFFWDAKLAFLSSLCRVQTRNPRHSRWM